MALEIERKYLVVNDSYLSMAISSSQLMQGYLSTDPQRTVRVRTRDTRGYITVKGMNRSTVRPEWEYEIPASDAREMLNLPGTHCLEKTRYIVPYEGKIWEVDAFHGRHEGLIVAEIELSSPDEPFSLPPFVGAEVTGDSRYYNSVLAAES